MGTSREIEGTEFDWFAIDQDGRFALFATSGRGVVPEAVLSELDAHDAIGSELEVTGWGTSAVWHGYSRIGLYVYDWSDEQQRYVRVAEPAVPPVPQLASDLSACPGLPRLELSFAQVAAIVPEWQDGT